MANWMLTLSELISKSEFRRGLEIRLKGLASQMKKLERPASEGKLKSQASALKLAMNRFEKRRSLE